ncbi:hypothetical protein FOA43_002921 [Brettanomyces nanus]|uniref:GPI inositol-deacylase n=1 Tax=Eeniella nana TaxID=13502 RepID=A0A875S2J9_EENNA|nr:uncharacterized protein FOA43_002921 [Brettanomyces nanus]QPG75566.1 hypothetical protein FOA43_002921 [Brettanomyces nanus]
MSPFPGINGTPPLSRYTSIHYRLGTSLYNTLYRVEQQRNVSSGKDNLLNCTGLRGHYETPKYPIILCHGFSGFDRLLYIPALKFSIDLSSFRTRTEKRQRKSEVLYKNLVEKDDQELDGKTNVDADSEDAGGLQLFEYWHGIKQSLEKQGCQVLVAKVPPFANIQTRARALDAFIQGKATSWQRKHHSKEKVKFNLVAHSMGGMDCRYLISKLEHNNYEVVSLTTISTPHRGTYAADFVMQRAPKELIDRHFPSIRQLTREYSARFNDKVRDDPTVKYFSFGASANPKFLNMYYLPWSLISVEEGPNDGMVSINSCKWGKYMGCLNGVDHKQLINWMGGIKRLKTAIGIQDKGFNPPAFYLDIADNLAKNVL